MSCESTWFDRNLKKLRWISQIFFVGVFVKNTAPIVSKFLAVFSETIAFLRTQQRYLFNVGHVGVSTWFCNYCISYGVVFADEAKSTFQMLVETNWSTFDFTTREMKEKDYRCIKQNVKNSKTCFINII